MTDTLAARHLATLEDARAQVCQLDFDDAVEYFRELVGHSRLCETCGLPLASCRCDDDE